MYTLWHSSSIHYETTGNSKNLNVQKTGGKILNKETTMSMFLKKMRR